MDVHLPKERVLTWLCACLASPLDLGATGEQGAMVDSRACPQVVPERKSL
jgi:hypothetical protein